MEFKIEQSPQRSVAGFHMVGPWEETVHQGFEQLALWVKSQKITGSEWLAVYYDNPDVVPPEKLRCDTVLRVPEDFVVPANSEGVILTRIEGGQYAIGRAHVDNNDFAKVWETFFDAVEGDGRYRITGRPCFEHYLNDGSESGVWEIDMYIPVANKS